MLTILSKVKVGCGSIGLGVGGGGIVGLTCAALTCVGWGGVVGLTCVALNCVGNCAGVTDGKSLTATRSAWRGGEVTIVSIKQPKHAKTTTTVAPSTPMIVHSFLVIGKPLAVQMLGKTKIARAA